MDSAISRRRLNWLRMMLNYDLLHEVIFFFLFYFDFVISHAIRCGLILLYVPISLLSIIFFSLFFYISFLYQMYIWVFLGGVTAKLWFSILWWIDWNRKYRHNAKSKCSMIIVLYFIQPVTSTDFTGGIPMCRIEKKNTKLFSRADLIFG